MRCGACGGTFAAPPGAPSAVCPYCRQPVAILMPAMPAMPHVPAPVAYATAQAKRSWGCGLIAVAIVAMLAGVFTRSWVTTSYGDESLRIGLLGVEQCEEGRCETEDYDQAGRGDELIKILAMIGKIAVAGTFVVAGLLTWTAVRGVQRRPAEGPALAGIILTALAIVGAFMWTYMMKTHFPFGPSYGWSFAVYEVGAIAGLVGCVLLRKPG